MSRLNDIKKSINKFFAGRKTRSMGSAVAVLLIIMVVLAAVFSAYSSDAEISLFYRPSENGAVVFSGKTQIRDTIPGSVSAVRYSGDKSVCAALMSGDSSYTLFVVDGSRIDEISSGCTNNFSVSYAGNAVVYLTSDGKMIRYDVRKRKSTDIDENISKFALSPDGKTILYSKNENSSEKLYIYTSSSAQFICDNYTPLAVSDNAEYIYILTPDNSLCLIDKSGAMRARLCSSVDSSYICFSEDLTDVAFYDGSYTYVSHEGKSRIRLTADKAAPLTKEKTKIYADSDNTAVICADGDLLDMFYCSAGTDGNNAVYFITDKHRSIDAAQTVSEYVFVKNNRLVYMTEDGHVYLYKKGESMLLFDGASHIEATADGRYIYCITKSSDLYVYHGGKMQKLTDSARSIYMTPWDELLLIRNDMNLYSVLKTRDCELTDENVTGCLVNGDTVFYCKNYDPQTGVFDLYCADKRNDFKETIDGVSWINIL